MNEKLTRAPKPTGTKSNKHRQDQSHKATLKITATINDPMATLHKKFDISYAKNAKIVSSHGDFETLKCCGSLLVWGDNRFMGHLPQDVRDQLHKLVIRATSNINSGFEFYPTPIYYCEHSHLSLELTCVEHPQSSSSFKRTFSREAVPPA